VLVKYSAGGKEPAPGETARLIPALNRQMTIADLVRCGYSREVAEKIVVPCPGVSLDPRVADVVHALYSQIPAGDKDPRVGQMDQLLGHMARLRPYGFGPLTPFQATELAKQSPRIVEMGGGSGFNAALLREHGAEVVSFDDYSYREDGKARWEKSGVDFAELERLLKRNPDDFAKWVSSSISAEKLETRLEAARLILYELTPAVGGGPQQGNPASLRQPELKDHDLFLAYPPSTDAFEPQGLLSQSLRNVAPGAQRIHVMPGGCETNATYPSQLLKIMDQHGWTLSRVLPSGLPNVLGKNDVLTFERKPSSAREQDLFVDTAREEH
jgi:hypothetical protein